MHSWYHWNTVNRLLVSKSVIQQFFESVGQNVPANARNAWKRTATSECASFHWRRIQNSTIALLDVPMIAPTISTKYH